MKNTVISLYYINRQHGATLVISMVLLAVITIIGLASIRSSTLELKMAASSRDSVVATQAAESALLTVERNLSATDFALSNFLPSCIGNSCFRPDCTNGLCFSGNLLGAATRKDCSLAAVAESGAPSAGTVVVRQHWREDALWKLSATPTLPTAEKPFTGFIPVITNSKVDGDGLSIPTFVRYMVEFLCFVPKDDEIVTDKDVNKSEGVPLFQVTVRAVGDAGRSTVMLQSVFKGGRAI